MAFLTFGPADVFDSHRVFFPGIEIPLQLVVDRIKPVPGFSCRAIWKVHTRRTMAVDTPTHAQWRKLANFIHILDRTMTGLALYLARADMLRMTKKHMIGEIMDADPFDGFSGVRIFSFLRIITRIAI
jgi:hypothetical protein